MTFSLQIIRCCIALTISSVVKQETQTKFPNHVPSSNFNELSERFLPGVHLDDLNARNNLVHQPHPVVRPYCDFLPQFSDQLTKISCNKIVDKLVTNVFFYRDVSCSKEVHWVRVWLEKVLWQIYIYIYIYRSNVMQLGSMFINNCNITLHVSDTFCVHPQEHLKKL